MKLPFKSKITITFYTDECYELHTTLTHVFIDVAIGNLMIVNST